MSGVFILAHHMQFTPAARARFVLDVDDLLDMRQVRGQRSAIGATLPDPVGTLDGIIRFLAGEAYGLVCSASSSPSSN